MAILNHGSTLRTADGGQTTTTIVTAANIGTYGVATNSTYYVGTTQNIFNRASGAQTLTGVSIDGNAATVSYPFNNNNALDLNSTGTTNQFSAFNVYYPSGGSYNQPIGGSQHFKILQFGRYNADDVNYWRGQMAMSFYTDRMFFRKEYTSTWGSWMEFLHTGNYAGYSAFTASLTSTVDARAPIFYDSNDTAYYVDPASNSRLLNLGLGNVTPDLRLSVSGDAQLSGILYLGGTAGSYNSWGSRTYTTSGVLYNNSSSVEFNNYGYGSTWTFTLGGGNATSSGAFRAPVFYDSDNTAYYLDAANSTTSLLVAGKVGIGNTSPSAKLHVSGASYTTASAANNNVRFEGGGGNGLGFGTIDATSTYASWIQSGYVPNFATATYALLLNPLGGNVGIGTTTPSQKLDVSGAINASTYVYAGVFYDNDNTVYYTNPSGTSNLVGLTVANTITGSVSGSSASCTGNAATASLATTSDRLTSRDNRTISPSQDDASKLRFGFTSYSNNNTGSWADYLHLRSYADGTGGNDNLVMFNKNAIGMRIWQQAFGSATAYATYKDVAFTDQGFYIGTTSVAINRSSASQTLTGVSIDGNAATATNGLTTSNYVSYSAFTGAISSGGAITATSYIYTSTYLQTGGNLIYPSGYGATQRLEVSNSANNNWIDGLTIAPGGTVTAPDNMRSPIFYDSNNTAYYVDPASTSNLVGLTVANTITGSVSGSSASCTGNAATATILQTARNINGTSFNGSAAITTATWGTARTLTIGSTGKSVDGSAGVSWSLAEIGALPLSGGQITGNTTFSADNHLTFGPNSTWGSSIRIGGNGYTATGTETASVCTTDGNLHLDGAKSTNGIYLNWYGGTSGVFFGNGSSGQVAFVSNAGNASFSGVVDATQFRDASNTGYYLDPAGNSQVVSIYANDWFRAQGNTGLYFQDKGYGITSAGAASNSYGNASTYGTGLNGWQGWGIGSRHCMMSTGGDNFGVHDNTRSWLYYWNGTYHNFQYGYLESASSVRAPLFYDSNDTTYYTDPAGFSLISSMGIGGLTSSSNVQMFDSQVNASSSYQQAPPLIIRKDSSATGTIDQAPVGLFIFNLNGTDNTWTKLSMGSREVTGAGNTVSIAGLAAQKTAGANGGWATGNLHFWTKSSATPITNMVAYSSGYVQSDYSFRAPIFYDSNDTAYYVDPAGESKLNYLRLTNSNALYFTTTSVAELNNEGNSTNVAFRMIKSGSSNSDGNNYGVLNLQRTNHTNGATNAGGSIFFELKDSGGTIREYAGISGCKTEAGAAGGRLIFHRYARTEVGYWDADQLYSSSSVRSPIFYDSNNTAYYLDPAAGTSLRIAGAIVGDHAAWTGEQNKIQWHSSHLYFQNTSDGYFIFRKSNGAEPFQLRISEEAGYATGSWRAPIFYDSNDTAYYLDPRSASVLSGLKLNGIDNDAAGNTSDAILWINKPNNNDWGIRVTGNLEYLLKLEGATSHSYNIQGLANGSEFWRCGTDLLYHNSNIRAPIFYDSANTAYYIDAASTSNLVGLTVANTITGSISGSSTFIASLGSGLNYDIDRTTKRSGLSHYSGYSTGTNRPTTYDYTLQVTDGSKGWEISMDWIATTGPAIYARSLRDCCQNWSSWVRILDNANYSFAANMNQNVRTTDNVTFVNVTGAIFYDAANTAYYIDPASTSVMNQINLAGILRRTASAAGYLEGNYPTGVDGNSSSAIYTIGGGYQPTATGLGNMYGCGYTVGNGTANPGLGATGWGFYVAGGGVSRIFLDSEVGYGIASNSWRAPVFYDSNNTAYYVDPNSTSNLVGLTVANTITGSITGNSATTTLATKATRANGNFYIDDNYGNTVVGVYTSTRYQGVFAMGDSYKLVADGSTTGNLYGIAWSHQNAGGAAANLASHGLLILENGVFKGAWGGGSLRTPGDVRGTLFYDWDNTGYYCDPASTSNLNAITAAGNITAAQYYTANWFRSTTSGNGLYNEATGQHFYSDSANYWNVASSSSSQGIRFRTGGHAGTVRGYIIADTNNDVGLLNQDGNWRVRVVGGDYTIFDGSSIRAQIFYDSNNTGYYIDAASTSVLNLVRTRNTFGERITVTSASSTTIDTQYNVTELTMSAFISTLTFSNIQASGIVHMWTIVTLGNGSATSVTWPAAIKWPGGTAPNITGTNTKRDIYQFVTYDGGTSIYAIIVGQNL